MRIRTLFMTAVACVCSVAVAEPAQAASVTHDYEMNESSGATVMHDTGSVRVNGHIGSDVTTQAAFGGAVGYRFPFNQSTADPAHLVTVPDNVSLDPESANYSLQVRYRTTNKSGNLNIVQKGQGTTAGGQVKVQQDAGIPNCIFRGSSGKLSVAGPASVADGAWHTLRCIRTRSALDLYIDSVHVDHKQGSTGKLDNVSPLSIAGKPRCDIVTISCDYFDGDIDYLRIQKGF